MNDVAVIEAPVKFPVIVPPVLARAALAIVVAALAAVLALVAWSYACFTLLAVAGNVIDELLIELIISG